ncbi:glycosyltransferase family 4 protein [Streptomyces paradoxus]|uniref:Glycosyltransferase involved in cell wall biosynthesis n=1 Tax=Streptomyces paradoxus TaxID=66375 RepID=A0A7W9WGI8_9ACTN|nr:glycosyltransferase family 4 protein [Streptomyces paradoxus]MBB6077857.1 glycosyltransferase involved in cell wall biosynthesis [Streptomyces paradoxus]
MDLLYLSRMLDPSLEPTVPKGLGGSVSTSLAVELSRNGHEVTLVTLSPDVTAPVEWRIGAVNVLVGSYREQHRARDAFRHERNAVRDLLDSVDTDVVHAHWTYEFGLGALASRHPCLISVHDWAPVILRRLPDPYRLVRLLMQAHCLMKARDLAVVSPYIGERLGRIGRNSAHLLPNGLPSGFFAKGNPLRESPVRRILSVNSDFSPLKNVGTLLRAFRAVRRQLGDAELVLVGNDFQEGGPAESWAHARGLASGTVFAGPLPIEDVLTAMDRADIFVAPTLEESFGMTVLESMARGLPIVAGRSSGAVPWLLDFGTAGELVDVRRSDEIASAIVRMAREPERRLLLGGEALRRARRFAWPGLTHCYEAQYRRIASAHGGRRL